MSWITLLSMAGIAIGVAAMIVVLSVINGFKTQLRQRFLAANAHVLLFQVPHGIDRIDDVKEKVRKDYGDDITGVSAFVHAETMATSGSIMHNILIRGIDAEARKTVQDMSMYVRPQSALIELADRQHKMNDEDRSHSVPLIIIGSGLASLLNAKVGDQIKLIRPETDTVGELKNFQIAGLYDSGLKHYDNKLGIVSVPDAQDFFRMGKKVHGLEIGLKKPENSIPIANSMSDKYPYIIREWQTFNKSMFEAMEMERSVIALIVVLVAIVASGNILTTLFITVTQKQRAISVLKALGSSNFQILKLFVVQGLLIGAIGSSVGILLALGISLLLERYEFIQLPDVYMLSRLPIEYDPMLYAAMAISGTLMCVFAGLYPAFIASRVNIVDGFKGKKAA